MTEFLLMAVVSIGFSYLIKKLDTIESHMSELMERVARIEARLGDE